MNKRFTLSIIFLAVMAFISSGCYTLLQHPGEEGGYSVTGGATDCIRCHPNYHDDYGFSHYYYPGYWSTYDRWGQYYAVPWWWDYYWYDNDYYHDDYSPRPSEAEKLTRPGDRFENITPPVPQLPRQPSSPGTPAPGNTEPTKVKENTSDQNTKTQTGTTKTRTDKPNENDKATRRSGRWKKQ